MKIALNFSPVLIKTIEVTWVSFRTLLTDFNELFAENNKFIFYFSAAKSDFFFPRRIFCQRILSLCCWCDKKQKVLIPLILFDVNGCETHIGKTSTSWEIFTNPAELLLLWFLNLISIFFFCISWIRCINMRLEVNKGNIPLFLSQQE